ncbi:unnamed protein product, partial [Polarella glacialis]
VDLKVGAMVILTRTIDARRGLVNGVQGRVVSFTGAGSLRQPVVFFNSLGAEVPVAATASEAKSGSKVLGVRVQLPLELSWAVSIHKSQGMTLSAVEVNVDTVFEHGQAYVAMSRAQTLAGIHLIGSEETLRRSVHAEPRCLAFHQQLTKTAAEEAALRANPEAGKVGEKAPKEAGKVGEKVGEEELAKAGKVGEKVGEEKATPAATPVSQILHLPTPGRRRQQQQQQQ